jgi:hypothetical protein
MLYMKEHRIALAMIVRNCDTTSDKLLLVRRLSPGTERKLIYPERLLD